MLGASVGALLRTKIQIWVKTKTQDAFGGDETWVLSATRWGRLIGISIGMELYLTRYMEQRSEATHELVLRNFFDFDIENTRFKVGNTYYVALEPAFDPTGGLKGFTNIRVRVAKEEEVIYAS